MTPSESPLDASWPKPVEPGAAITKAIRSECTAHLRPVRHWCSLTRWALSVLLSGSVVVVLMVDGLTHHPTDAFAETILAALGWGLVQGLLLYVGLGRPPGRRGGRALRWGLTLTVPLLLMGYLTVIARHWSSFDATVSSLSAHSVADCGLHALLYGSLATLGILLVWRRTDPLSPGLSGAMGGLAGGLVGVVALGFSCPCSHVWHLWLGHGSAVVLLVVLGWVLGRRWLSP
jgi:hypothetical protein